MIWDPSKNNRLNHFIKKHVQDSFSREDCLQFSSQAAKFTNIHMKERQPVCSLRGKSHKISLKNKNLFAFALSDFI